MRRTSLLPRRALMIIYERQDKSRLTCIRRRKYKYSVTWITVNRKEIRTDTNQPGHTVSRFGTAPETQL
ncbi:hypothetical protein SGPA1_11214 [Streptomyces misionensis JCM 4497]